MKLVTLTILVLLFLISTCSASGYDRKYCMPKWKARRNCADHYYRDGCKYKVRRTVRKRVCRRKCRKCKKRCYRKKVRRTYYRKGYVCDDFFGRPNPGFPLPSASSSPAAASPCTETCVRWWSRATYGCNPVLCMVAPCTLHHHTGWHCTRIAPAVPTPTASPTPVGAASCFGGCRPLVAARRGCNALYCKNVACRRVGTELYYSCVPNFIPTVSPSASSSPSSSPGSSSSPSPVGTPSASPVTCPRTCQTNGDAFTRFTAANTNCQRPQCAVVGCSLSTSSGTTGFGCVFSRELAPGQIDFTSFNLTGASPSPSLSPSPVSPTPTSSPVSPTPSTSPTASSASVARIHIVGEQANANGGSFGSFFG